MSWLEEHKKQIERLPEDLRNAHSHSSHHRAELLTSNACGCFCCCQIFTVADIKEWTDFIEKEVQTALCPKCGIDSVIGSNSGFSINLPFLKKMKSFWF